MWTEPDPGARFPGMNEKAASIPSYQPLYGQIKSLLVSSLANGEWKPGQMIPSESELASRFGVSQGTVRKAIDELATDNLLMRRQGRGTFVATHAEDRNSTRFLRLRAADGSVETVEVNRSSGHRILDAAAVRIVEMSAPYAAFPPDVRRDTDILHITRTWTFTKGDELVSQ